MKNTKLIITPKTKVQQLIETYPQLEDVLTDYVPSFKILKNPVLKKTVASVSTLQQMAGMGSVKVEDLINRMRKEVGQDNITIEKDMGYVMEKPVWFDEEKVVTEFDVREILAAGEHPVNQVVSEVAKLNSGDIYKVIAPFLPAPMIDKITALNFKHWVVNESNNLYIIFFYKS